MDWKLLEDGVVKLRLWAVVWNILLDGAAESGSKTVVLNPLENCVVKLVLEAVDGSLLAEVTQEGPSLTFTQKDLEIWIAIPR